MLSINLEDLEDKWSLISHEACVDCGMNFEDNNEVPLRLWRNPESPDCTELALCWKCGKKRMRPDTKGGAVMLEIPKGREKGQWWPLRVLSGTSSYKGATFICPDCSHKGTLESHSIAEDGTVTPSVECVCGFHKNLKLIGW